MDLDDELKALAVQKDLPADLVRRLIRHPVARRQVALMRRDLTEDQIEEIMRLGATRSLAANGSVHWRTRARLAEHPEPVIRCAIAAGVKDEPAGLLARLAADPDESVRWFLALNANLPADLLARLAADPETRVREAVVPRWRELPDEVRRMLLTDADAGIRRLSARTFVPPADLLSGLLADPETRAGAVRHSAPTYALATDPDADVRQAVAAHPDLPADLRDLLAEDSDLFVRNEVAGRSDTLPELRDRLAAGLEATSPVEAWFLSFRRDEHACPPRPPEPPTLTRPQAEWLLERAGL
ncbi:hypothetical protein [Streptomyces sp. NPDC047014]|uniref:hypothetical protein n=1 Tax=Streptomyces sp. NPDC047014 TaxID=3155736 RepID=UPI0033C34748